MATAGAGPSADEYAARWISRDPLRRTQLVIRYASTT